VSSDIFKFDLDSGCVQKLDQQLQTGRENHAAVISTDEKTGETFLLIIGGWDGYSSLTSCEKFKVAGQNPWLTLTPVNSDNTLHELKIKRNKPAVMVI